MKFVYFLSLLLLWPLAAEAAKPVVVCATLKELDEAIYNCGGNDYASERAEACAQAVMASWQGAADGLAPLLAKAGEAQAGAEENSAANYREASQAMADQILMMQAQTSLIASYVGEMIDSPDAKNADESLECFNQNFDKIQKVVRGLDEEIVRAKKVRDVARALGRGSETNRSALATSLSKMLADGKAARLSRKPSTGPSDVTGLHPEVSLSESGPTQKVTKDEENEVIAGLGSEKLTGGSAVTAEASNARHPAVVGAAMSVAEDLFHGDGQGSSLFGLVRKHSGTAPVLPSDTDRSLASTGTAVSASAGVGGPEMDLFHRVTAKYRASGLFR